MSGWAFWPDLYPASVRDLTAALEAPGLQPDGVRGRLGCAAPEHFLAWYPRLTPMASLVAGRSLVPSKAYLVLWTPSTSPLRWQGAEPWLLPHRDDKAWTDWNLTVGLHALPEGIHWPLYVQGPGGRLLDLGYGPGDAVCYRGREAWHWRLPMPKDLITFAAVYFHFVEAV